MSEKKSKSKPNEQPGPAEAGLALLVKLGSLAVHIDEFLSPDGHDFDRAAIASLLHDQDVIEFVDRMTKEGFLPVKRKAPRR